MYIKCITDFTNWYAKINDWISDGNASHEREDGRRRRCGDDELTTLLGPAPFVWKRRDNIPPPRHARQGRVAGAGVAMSLLAKTAVGRIRSGSQPRAQTYRIWLYLLSMKKVIQLKNKSWNTQKLFWRKEKYPQASKIHEKNLEGRIGHNKPK